MNMEGLLVNADEVLVMPKYILELERSRAYKI